MRYHVSYNQVYTWVKKYPADGEDGLTDKRGHHKSDDGVDELERLRRENLRLKRKLDEQSKVVELLRTCSVSIQKQANKSERNHLKGVV